MRRPTSRVLIVGAGPTGLLTAYGLAKAGAAVTVIDREPDVVASPRATVYLPSTLKVLDELGLLGEVLQAAETGYLLDVRFKLTGYIGHIDHRLVADLTPYASSQVISRFRGALGHDVREPSTGRQCNFRARQQRRHEIPRIRLGGRG